ncbi:MAG TPA: hypothetical protein VN327_08955, partial [Pseudonocardiaceae bacterium]|nr:hypothetical protein [Pseudonocardiaceae bacterium]
RYGVKPGGFRDGAAPVKGYQTTGPHGLADAWDRYLPPRHPLTSVTAVTAVTPQVSALPIPTLLPIQR